MNRLQKVLSKHDPSYGIKTNIKTYKMSKTWNVGNEHINKPMVREIYNDILPHHNFMKDKHLDGIIESFIEKDNNGIYIYILDNTMYLVSVIDMTADTLTILKDHLTVEFTEDEKILYFIKSRRRIDLVFKSNFNYKQKLNLMLSNIPGSIRDIVVDGSTPV